MSRFHSHQHRHEHQPGPFALHSCRGKYGEDVTVGGKHYCGGIRRFSKYRRQNANNNYSQERKGSLISFDNPFRKRSSRETGIHPSASYSRYLRGKQVFCLDLWCLIYRLFLRQIRLLLIYLKILFLLHLLWSSWPRFLDMRLLRMNLVSNLLVYCQRQVV